MVDLEYCPACEKERGFKRQISVGTLLAVIFTAGVWLLALPFYPKRCIVCGYPWDYAKKHREAKEDETADYEYPEPADFEGSRWFRFLAPNKKNIE
jgi:hypothetical protein